MVIEEFRGVQPPRYGKPGENRKTVDQGISSVRAETTSFGDKFRAWGHTLQISHRGDGAPPNDRAWVPTRLNVKPQDPPNPESPRHSNDSEKTSRIRVKEGTASNKTGPERVVSKAPKRPLGGKKPLSGPP